MHHGPIDAGEGATASANAFDDAVDSVGEAAVAVGHEFAQRPAIGRDAVVKAAAKVELDR